MESFQPNVFPVNTVSLTFVCSQNAQTRMGAHRIRIDLARLRFIKSGVIRSKSPSFRRISYWALVDGAADRTNELIPTQKADSIQHKFARAAVDQ